MLKLAKPNSGKIKWAEPPDNISQCVSVYYHLNMILIIILNINEIELPCRLSLGCACIWRGERVVTAIGTSSNEAEMSCETTSLPCFVFYLHFQLMGEMKEGSTQTE